MNMPGLPGLPGWDVTFKKVPAPVDIAGIFCDPFFGVPHNVQHMNVPSEARLKLEVRGGAWPTNTIECYHEDGAWHLPFPNEHMVLPDNRWNPLEFKHEQVGTVTCARTQNGWYVSFSNLDVQIDFAVKDELQKVMAGPPHMQKLVDVPNEPDLRQQMAKLQFVMGGQISQTAGLKSLSIDYRDEVRRMMEEQAEEADWNHEVDVAEEVIANVLRAAQQRSPGELRKVYERLFWTVNKWSTVPPLCYSRTAAKPGDNPCGEIPLMTNACAEVPLHQEVKPVCKACGGRAVQTRSGVETWRCTSCGGKGFVDDLTQSEKDRLAALRSGVSVEEKKKWFEFLDTHIDIKAALRELYSQHELDFQITFKDLPEATKQKVLRAGWGREVVRRYSEAIALDYIQDFKPLTHHLPGDVEKSVREEKKPAYDPNLPRGGFF